MTRPARSVLLLGGARSGKSRLAVDLAHTWDHPVTFVATATAGDDDMAARIERHRHERPAEWQTLEAATKLAATLRDVDAEQALVIDCITMWVTNEMLAGADVTALTTAASEVAVALVARPTPSVVVTNEVGSGVVPATTSGREFRDLLGAVNRVLADRLDATYLVVAGRLLDLHRPGSVFPGLGPA